MMGAAGALASGGARIVLATHNRGKIIELERILAEELPGLPDGIVVGAGGLGLSDVVEDGLTFAQNALKKARAAAEETGLVAVADDSGLAVDVLGGCPGIFSARWSGTHGDDAANNALLLAQLGDIAPEHRSAHFACAAALVAPGAGPDGEALEVVEHGRMTGVILREPRGEGGFGYDPLFLPDGQERTSAQLSPAEKDAISHRGRAFRALAPHLARLLTAAS